ncbi:heavy metal transporter [Bifidobacterium phasiani]|uniref:Heavy metal transporter n=1 Tax=Bifidobacterium phasiani TaxID=2834431 RepID=A0ABS6W7A8_9BIFI|nr:heavy metal transporter [Bifidobacterium phasiani]MBW3081974.1 heavy metal transporter [Bifidobacterium phasiani]
MFNHHRIPWRIRLVDAPAEPGGGGTGEGGEPVDWQAKYHEAIKHSRTWEERAKANKKDADANRQAAEELEKLKESSMSDAERTAKRISELEAENNRYKSERQHAEWARKVSEETGVPANLLRGDSLDEMREFANQLDQYAHPKPKGMPNQGGTPNGKPDKARELDWANQLFSNL